MIRPFNSYIVWAVGTLVSAVLVGQAPNPAITGPAGIYVTTQTLAAAGPIPLPIPFTGPAGEYTLQVTAVGPATVSRTANSVTISWGTPTPPPPQPQPPPVTQTGDLYILALFDETKALTPAQQAVHDSTTLGPALTALTPAVKTTWVVGDVASPAFSTWAKAAQEVGIPAFVVIAVGPNNVGTQVGKAVPIPNTEAEVVAFIKTLRGLNKKTVGVK